MGLALKQAGYTVRVAASETFKDAIKALELEFYPVGGNVVSEVAGDSSLQKAMQADNPLKVIKSFNTLKAHAFALQKGFYDACLGSDAIIYHPGTAIGYFAARALGKKIQGENGAKRAAEIIVGCLEPERLNVRS